MNARTKTLPLMLIAIGSITINAIGKDINSITSPIIHAADTSIIITDDMIHNAIIDRIDLMDIDIIDAMGGYASIDGYAIEIESEIMDTIHPIQMHHA